MSKIIFPTIILAALLVTHRAEAQNPAASQQADALHLRQFESTSTTNNAAPEFYTGETSDVGPQSLLELKQRRHWFRAFADEQLFYSDNVFLTDGGKQDADVLVSTINVALAPDAFDLMGGKLAPQVGYQHQWFSYGLLSDDNLIVVDFNKSTVPTTNSIHAFDFNVQTIFADTTFAWHGWDFTVGLDYRRFLDSNDYNEFYHEVIPRLAARYTFQFSEKKSITVGYEGDYRLTDTQHPLPINKGNYNDRTDHSLMLVGNWKLCRHAIAQPFYRLQYSYFTHAQNGREDWLNTFGVALQLPFTQNIALRTFISYETLSTDGAFVQNYNKLDIGGGLNLSVRF